MSNIRDIELIIRDLIITNEAIVSAYDSKRLCSSYEDAKANLKELCDRKNEIIMSLTDKINEFFNIKQNFITRKLKITSFALLPTIAGYEFKFNIPKTVDRTSRQYFCYTSMMDRLQREYDVIALGRDGYYILDITAGLNLEKLFEGD